MTFFRALDTRPGQVFARELAAFILSELNDPKLAKESRFMQKANKALVKSATRLQAFKAAHKLNFYLRANLANTFLWALKDGGCPQEYADQLTEWLTLRL